MEWEADFFGLGELLKIIGDRKKAEKAEEERKKRKGPKMSRLECLEKAAEMFKKSAEAKKMISECPKRGERCTRGNRCRVCKHALKSYRIYVELAEYKNKSGGGHF